MGLGCWEIRWSEGTASHSAGFCVAGILPPRGRQNDGILLLAGGMTAFYGWFPGRRCMQYVRESGESRSGTPDVKARHLT